MAHRHGIITNVLHSSRELYRALTHQGAEVSRVQTLEGRLAELERARVSDQRLLEAERKGAERLSAEKGQWEKEKQELEAQKAQLEKEKQELEAQKAQLEKEKAELEAKLATFTERLNTNSRNSSQPASQDRPEQKPPRTRLGRLPGGVKRKRGGQVGHVGHHRPLLDVPDDRIVKVPCEKTCACGGTVEPSGLPYRHQQLEFPEIQLELTEYQLEHGVCGTCKKVSRAALPAGVVPGMFGPSVLAFIALMVGAYQLSRRSVQAVLAALTGLRVSASTVSEAEERISAALALPYDEGRTGVQQATAANFDETGSRRDGKRSWIWLAASTGLAVFLVSAGRGRQAFTQLLGGLFSGIMTSDRWHTYNRYATKFRQLCFAHLLRDFQKIAERTGESEQVGKALVAATLQMFGVWGKFRDEELTRDELREQLIPVREEIERLLQEGTKLEKAPKTVETCRNILKLKDALWTFVEHEEVEPTNNRAERLIRNAVLWRKRSLGTWSERGDRYLERLLTVMVSLRLQNRPALPWLTATIRAHYGQGSRPSLLP